MEYRSSRCLCNGGDRRNIWKIQSSRRLLLHCLNWVSEEVMKSVREWESEWMRKWVSEWKWMKDQMRFAPTIKCNGFCILSLPKRDLHRWRYSCGLTNASILSENGVAKKVTRTNTRNPRKDGISKIVNIHTMKKKFWIPERIKFWNKKWSIQGVATCCR